MRPIPRSDPETALFWDALRDHRLTVQRCANGHAQLYPRPWCRRCHAAVEWIDAAGTGTVYSFTVIRQNFQKPFRDELPYVVALIDLDEGARLMSNIVGCEPEAVSIGAAVRVRFEPIGDEAVLPLFELTSTDG